MSNECLSQTGGVLRRNETPLKIVVANCNDKGGFKTNAEFLSFVDHHQPDIIRGCESKLNGKPTYGIFPSDFMIYRKKIGGGVSIALKDIYPSYPLENHDTECEIVSASLQLSCQRKVLLASFYRLPNSNLETT